MPSVRALAWPTRINAKTVLRAGFGVVYNATLLPAGSSANTASTSAFPSHSGLITGLFKDGMPDEVHPVWPSFEPNNGQPVGAVVGMPNLLDPNAGRPARLVQWNISHQTPDTRNLVLRPSFVRGVWWGARRRVMAPAAPRTTWRG